MACPRDAAPAARPRARRGWEDRPRPGPRRGPRTAHDPAQCYEGLDESKALYEWDYGKQMLYTQLLRDVVSRELSAAPSIAAAASMIAGSEATFFSRGFLIPRPLLAAITSPVPAVLLIDEVDRADPEFEALLLEVLSELQVTVPELGTIKADPTRPPVVVLTTNGTRDMTDALHRRCLHLFLDYPPPSREMAILEATLPGIKARLLAEVIAFVNALRALDLRKAPAISETIDWARALLLLGHEGLDRRVVEETLGLLLKHHADTATAKPKLGQLVAKATRAGDEAGAGERGRGTTEPRRTRRGRRAGREVTRRALRDTRQALRVNEGALREHAKALEGNDRAPSRQRRALQGNDGHFEATTCTSRHRRPPRVSAFQRGTKCHNRVRSARGPAGSRTPLRRRNLSVTSQVARTPSECHVLCERRATPRVAATDRSTRWLCRGASGYLRKRWG